MNMKRSKWTTDNGFRLIPTFTEDHNLARWLKHVDRLCKKPHMRQGMASTRAKMRARKALGYA